MYIATGQNTFSAKEHLKKIGLQWNGERWWCSADHMVKNISFHDQNKIFITYGVVLKWVGVTVEIAPELVEKISDLKKIESVAYRKGSSPHFSKTGYSRIARHQGKISVYNEILEIIKNTNK